MRLFYFSLPALALLTPSCGTNAPTVCDQQQQPAAICTQTCNTSPGATNTCPIGYTCRANGHCDADCTQGGTQCGAGKICNSDGRCQSMTGCNGIGCQVVDCAKDGKPPTTLTGTVFAPNGTLPLSGIIVYVPGTSVRAFTDGASCDRC